MKKLYLILFALVCVTVTHAQTFTFDGINYNVTSPTTVEVGDNTGFSGQYVYLPLTVSDGTNNYVLRSIKPNAFYNCSTLFSVQIPNTITSIGDYAFNNCTFLNRIIVYWGSPISINPNVFNGLTLSSIILEVPSNTNANYNNALVWTDFFIQNHTNQNPTNLYLSNSSIDENVLANTIIGNLTTLDSDTGVNSHVYGFVGGVGDTDNNAFNISGNILRINASPDYEIKNNYSIRLRTTDQGGLSYDKAFTITINDLQEAPYGCWAQVSAGGYHTLAIAQDGTLWSWGDNANGQLGVGPVGTDKLDPTQVSAQGNWASVSAGEYYSLAIKKDGTLWAWGNNQYGQLGNGITTQQNTPVQIGTATNWSKITAGYNHSMAIKTDGTLWAWGRNTNGQIGNGNTTQQNTPIQVGTATDWDMVKSGRNHTLALKSNGQLWSWGQNTFGQLGQGNYTSVTTPLQVGTATDWKFIQAGDYHSMVLKTDGTIWAWGDNASGQLGIGNTTEQTSPVQVGTATDWKYMTSGAFHGYAIKTNGTLWAWGDNYFGQVGNGNFAQQNSPVQVGTATDWYSVIAGNYFGISQKTTGNFMSWGDNQGGQLGNGATTPNTTGQNIPANMGCSANVLVFDGVDDKVTIPNTGTSVLGDNTANGGSYTITTVVKLNNNVNTVLIDRSGASTGNPTGFSLTTNSSGNAVFSQGMSNNANTTVTSPSPLPTNVNMSLTVTFNSSTNDLKLYVDGLLRDVATAVGVPVSNLNPTTLGSRTAGGNISIGSNFNGKISHIKINDYPMIARQVAELSENLLSNRNIQVTNTVAEYKFNQGIANGNNAGLTTLYNEVAGGPVGTLENFTLNGTTSNWSFDATANETLNTNEFSISNTVKVYPNPSEGIFTIALNEDAQVEVYNLLGKLVYESKAQAGKVTVDISNYQAGLYLLNVTSENGSITKKIIKE